MDTAVSGAVPYLRDAARSEIVVLVMTPEQRRSNRKTALVLAVVIAVIFAWAWVRNASVLGAG